MIRWDRFPSSNSAFPLALGDVGFSMLDSSLNVFALRRNFDWRIREWNQLAIGEWNQRKSDPEI
jgi:hypothetical protein